MYLALTLCTRQMFNAFNRLSQLFLVKSNWKAHISFILPKRLRSLETPLMTADTTYDALPQM